MLFKKGRGRPPKKKFKLRYLFFVAVAGFLALALGFRQGWVDTRVLSWVQINQQLGLPGLVLGIADADWQAQLNLLLQGLKERVGESPSKDAVSGAESFKHLMFKFAVVADSHEDTQVFPKILKQIQAEEVDFFIHLGDLVNSGELERLQEARQLLDATGLLYYVLPGDHDYNWLPQHDLASFKKTFNLISANQVYEWDGFVLILLDNSNNSDNPLDAGARREWLRARLKNSAEKPILLFTAKPLFSPYFSDKADANGPGLLGLLKEGKIVQVFSGNTHTFARYPYPDELAGIWTTTVGAVGRTHNPLPLWVLVEVFEGGQLKITPKPYL